MHHPASSNGPARPSREPEFVPLAPSEKALAGRTTNPPVRFVFSCRHCRAPPITPIPARHLQIARSRLPPRRRQLETSLIRPS